MSDFTMRCDPVNNIALHPPEPRQGGEWHAERVAALVPVEMLEAHIQEHRVAEAKLTMRLIRYRELLEEHGIEPPDNDEDELLAMWQDCRAVVSTASEFVAKLGPARELLAGSWKPAA